MFEDICILLRLNGLMNIADPISCAGMNIKYMQKSAHGCQSRPSAIVNVIKYVPVINDNLLIYIYKKRLQKP